MNRSLVLLAVVVVLLGGGAATAGSFAGGDEVATDSGVYLVAADSENGETYVEYDEERELRLRFDSVPPDARTTVDDLFVVGFAGYEDDENATTVELDTETDRVTLYRMDTGETVTGGAITLRPESSVTLGATVEPVTEGYTDSVRFSVRVPDDRSDPGTPPGDGGAGGGGTGGGGGGSGDGDGSGSDGDTGTGGDEGDGAGGGSADDGSDGGTGGADGETDESGAGDDTGDVNDGETGGTGDQSGGDGDGADGASGSIDGSDDQDGDAGDPTAEPAGVGFDTLSLGWSLFAGFLAGVTNYLVQTRIRDVLPALKTERSARRERVRTILAREAVITVVVIALTVVVAGVLSSAGVTGTAQLVATLAFSAVVGGVSGVRGFPRI